MSGWDETPAPTDLVPGCSALVIDFETATRARASACAIGMIWVRENAIVARAFHLIRPPGNDYDWFNTDLHGIGPEDTAESPDFGRLWPRLRPHFEAPGVAIVAHNARFDIGVLWGALDHYGYPRPAMETLCTVALARRTWPDLPNYRLPTVARHIGHPFRHHDALEDAEACAMILIEAARAAEEAAS